MRIQFEIAMKMFRLGKQLFKNSKMICEWQMAENLSMSFVYFIEQEQSSENLK